MKANKITNSLLKYSVVGVFATVIHAIAVFLQVEFLLLKPYFANGIAFFFATSFSYFFNTFWSFKTRFNIDNVRKYFLVSSIGFIEAMVISGIWDMLGFSYVSGIFIVAILVPALGFLMNYFWTYKK